jgi:hypothetical protein
LQTVKHLSEIRIISSACHTNVAYAEIDKQTTHAQMYFAFTVGMSLKHLSLIK